MNRSWGYVVMAAATALGLLALLMPLPETYVVEDEQVASTRKASPGRQPAAKPATPVRQPPKGAAPPPKVAKSNTTRGRVMTGR